MMRASACFLALFVAGCSSSSGTSVDGGGDVLVVKTHDAGHDAKKDAPPADRDAGTVCSPAPAPDAGIGDAAIDAARDAVPDVTDATAKPDVDAGPIACTRDTECPAGDICDTNRNQCIANVGGDAGKAACSNAPPDGGGAVGTCAVNADDICCGPLGGCTVNPAHVDAGDLPATRVPLPATDVCCPGAAGDSYCQGKLSDDMATCSGNVCTTCLDTCVRNNLSAYQKFLGYQLTDCGCTANGECYSDCHDATSAEPSSACGTCLAAQTAEDLSSTCTLTAAGDCSNDPACTAFQACAGACPM
jgi:Cys-rich repeat protein